MTTTTAALGLLLLLLSPPVQESPPEPPYERMVLPYARNGLEDRAPSAEHPRHVLELPLDGRVLAGGEVVHDPSTSRRPLDDVLDDALTRIVGAMPRAPGSEDGPEVLAAPLLIRADLVGPFADVLAALEQGVAHRLRDYHLAVGDMSAPRIADDGTLLPTGEPEQYLPLSLPLPADDGPPPARTALGVRVVEPGRKLEATRAEEVPWKGEEGTRFRWDMDSRVVAYAIGDFETRDRVELMKRLAGLRRVMAEGGVRLRIGDGVTVAEAVHVLDVLRGLGVQDVRFR